MANEKTEQEKAAEKLAAEKLAAEKLTAKPQEPAKTTSATPYEIVKDPLTGEDVISTGHLTRDSIVQFQRAKFMETGKSADEALTLALKRGYEMVKEAPAAK